MKISKYFFLTILCVLLSVSCKKEKALLDTKVVTGVNSEINPSGEITLRDGQDSIYTNFGADLYQTYADYFAEEDKSSVSSDWFYDRAFPGGENPTINKAYIEHFVKTQLDMYESLGFREYVKNLQMNGLINEVMTSYLNDLNDQLQPKFAASATFGEIEATIVGTEASVNANTSLTATQRGALLVFTTFLRTTLKYFNDNGFPSSPLIGGLSDRDGCESTLYTGASGIAGALVAMGTYVNMIEGPVALLFAGSLSVPIVGAIGAVVAIAIYCWGDDLWCWVFNCDVLDCHSVSDIHPLFTGGCNNATINAFGGGSDISSYVWVNTNAIPAIATTTNSALAITRTNPAIPVVVSVTSVCQDGTTQIPPRTETIAFPNSSSDPTPPISIIDGPFNTTVNTPVTFICSFGSIGLYSLTWSATGGGIIISTGQNSVTMKFPYSGSKTITATLTNTCSGTFTTATRTITVN